MVGAVSCSDLTMDLSRNCTPGCQCQGGMVQQVGVLLQLKHKDACRQLSYVLIRRHNADISRMVHVFGSLSAAVTWMEGNTNPEMLCSKSAGTGELDQLASDEHTNGVV